MSRFSKPKKKFTPSTRIFGNESLESQVLSTSTVRSGTSGSKSGTWSWKDSYSGDQFIPQDPIILASSFYVTVYEQVDLFVTDETENEYLVLDEEGNPENYILWTDNVIGDEGLFVLNENGEPEEFQTYDD